MFCASIVVACGLRLELRNHHWEKRRYNRVAWLIVLVALGLGTLVFREGFRNDPKPHLRLFLDTSVKTPDSTKSMLMFTNDFLFIKDPKHSPKSVEFLAVRVPNGKTNSVLRFGALNDSAFQNETSNDAELTAEVVELETPDLIG
jgi:hypothetical protein